MKHFLLCGLIFFSTINTAAGEVDLLGTFGWSRGGDTLTNINAAALEEDDLSSDDAKAFRAGNGIAIKLGAVYSPSDEFNDWEVQITFGWKRSKFSEDDANYSNFDDLEFSRFPLDIMGFYRFHILRFGAGLTYHINPVLGGDGLASQVDGNFDNSLGVILGVDIMIRNLFIVGLNYEIIDYRSSTEQVDANNFGLYAGIRF